MSSPIIPSTGWIGGFTIAHSTWEKGDARIGNRFVRLGFNRNNPDGTPQRDGIIITTPLGSSIQASIASGESLYMRLWLRHRIQLNPSNLTNSSMFMLINNGVLPFPGRFFPLRSALKNVDGWNLVTFTFQSQASVSEFEVALLLTGPNPVPGSPQVETWDVDMVELYRDPL